MRRPRLCGQESYLSVDFNIIYCILALHNMPTIKDITNKFNKLVKFTNLPSGCSNNSSDNLDISYNSTTQQFTLTAISEDVNIVHKGRILQVIPALNSALSPAFIGTPTGAIYFKYTLEDGFIISQTPWNTLNGDVQIAVALYTAGGAFIRALRQPHGFMSKEVRQVLHDTVGAYIKSGGVFSNFTINSNVATNRRPRISTTTLVDEDSITTIPQLITNSYTRFFLSGTGAVNNYVENATEFIPLSGNRPFYNQNNAGTWQQTLLPNNAYAKGLIIAMPSTSDSKSQNQRYIFIQPQAQSGTLATINALTVNSFILGDLALISPEYSVIGEFVIRFTAGNWVIISITKYSKDAKLF